MNVYTFSGNLGQNAEQRRIQGDKAVVSFSVPVKSGFGNNEKTTWVDCALWGKRAESKLYEHMKKGTFVVVSGEASLRTWTKTDGSEGSKLSVNVQEITLGGKSGGMGQSDSSSSSQPPAGDLDDDIIF